MTPSAGFWRAPPSPLSPLPRAHSPPPSIRFGDFVGFQIGIPFAPAVVEGNFPPLTCQDGQFPAKLLSPRDWARRPRKPESRIFWLGSTCEHLQFQQIKQQHSFFIQEHFIHQLCKPSKITWNPDTLGHNPDSHTKRDELYYRKSEK